MNQKQFINYIESKNRVEITKVTFRKEPEGNVLAVFPEVVFNNMNHVQCYSQIGQHSACQEQYYNKLPKATPEEYKEIKNELDNLGYNLKVLR